MFVRFEGPWPPSPVPFFAEAHGAYTRAMRDLIRLGLPIVEISRDEAERVVDCARSVATLYGRLPRQNSTDIATIIDCSMKARQIMSRVPTPYRPLLETCLNGQKPGHGGQQAQAPASPNDVTPVPPAGVPTTPVADEPSSPKDGTAEPTPIADGPAWEEHPRLHVPRWPGDGR